MTYRQGVPLLRHALFFTAFFIGLSLFFIASALFFMKISSFVPVEMCKIETT